MISAQGTDLEGKSCAGPFRDHQESETLVTAVSVHKCRIFMILGFARHNSGSLAPYITMPSWLIPNRVINGIWIFWSLKCERRLGSWHAASKITFLPLSFLLPPSFYFVCFYSILFWVQRDGQNPLNRNLIQQTIGFEVRSADFCNLTNISWSQYLSTFEKIFMN